MGTCWPEKQSTNRERLINELVQGQGSAHQLQILLQKPYDDGCLISSADELLVKILRSFNHSLSVLGCTESGAEVCQNLASSQVVDSAACYDNHDWRSEDSGESKKRPAAKDKRGRYKRKKTSQSWTIVRSTIEDGHAWRKYGQKEILNAKYPRSYFRCTRKFDQGCKATKQVQRKEDDSSEILYHTTYIGHHTCIDMLKAPQIIADSSDPWESHTNIISSSSKIPSNNGNHHHHPFISLSTPAMVKQESVEETPSDLTDNNNNNNNNNNGNNNVSSLDSIKWKDIMPFGEDPVAADVANAMMGCDYGVVDSAHHVCSSARTEVTAHALDMDFVVKSIDFDSDFRFDEGEFGFSGLE